MAQGVKYLECIICGKKYKGCRTCEDRVEYNPWRRYADTPKHYQVFRVIKDINAEIITNTEAKEMLDNIGIGLADLDEFLPHVKSFLEVLFVEKTSKKPKVATKKEEVSNEVVVEEVEIETSEEQ